MQIIGARGNLNEPLNILILEHGGVNLEVCIDETDAFNWSWVGRLDWTVSLANAEKLGMTENQLLKLIDETIKQYLNKENAK